MKFFPWFGAFLAALLLEVSVFPLAAGGFAPPFTRALLILGIAGQRFWPGFFYAGLAGMLLDAVHGGGVHTLVAIGTFFAMRAFSILTQWEEPLNRIGAVASGLVLQPLLRYVSARLAVSMGGSAVYVPQAADALSGLALREVAFAAGWFTLFAWFAIRRAARLRARRSLHL